MRGYAYVELKPEKGKKGGGAASDLNALLDESLPRADISKQINAKLVAMINEADPKVRKQACDKVEEILKAANSRILPNGLNELMDNMKKKMNDPNKAIVRAYMQLVGNLYEALGAGGKSFNKKVLPTLI